MSKWDAMRKRETLHDFPCPREGWAKGEPRLRCYPELEKCGQDGECPYEFVYRQYIALRAVVEGESGGWRPDEKAEALRILANENARHNAAQRRAGGSFQKGQVLTLRQRADAWEALT